MRRTLFLILIVLCPLAAEAQTLVQKADSLLDLHYNARWHFMGILGVRL